MIMTTLGEKGQVTLPMTIRRKLGLAPKKRFQVIVSGEDIVLRPLKGIDELYGILHERTIGVTDDWETIRRKTQEAVAEEVAREGME